MANMYRSVLSGGGTAPTGDAVAADVLTGKTFSNANATGISGTMPNNGAVSGTATPSQPYTIPAGYHNGLGSVTAADNVTYLKSISAAPATTPLGLTAGTYKMTYFGRLNNGYTVTSKPNFSISNGTIVDDGIQTVDGSTCNVTLDYTITVAADSTLAFSTTGVFDGTGGAGLIIIIYKVE